MKNSNRRIINIDFKKPGTRLGEPYTLGPTMQEYRESKNMMTTDEWRKPQK